MKLMGKLSCTDMTELASYVSVTNCSAGGTRKERDCPMLYTAVAGVCLSFLPFAVSCCIIGKSKQYLHIYVRITYMQCPY